MSIPFTTFLPLIGMFCVLALGILVYFKDRKSKLNSIFGLITISLSVILFGTFEMFLSQTEDETMLWDRFIYIGAVFLPALMYHFSIVFSKKKGNKKLLLSNYVLSILFLIASRTDYFVSGLFRYSWGVHTQARILHHIFLFFFFALVILTLKNIFNHYRLKTLSKIEKMQARFILIAFFVLLGIGPLGYLPAYNIGIYPFAYFSFIFFVLILAYGILKHHLLNIRVITTEFFVGLTAIVLFVEIFFFSSFLELIFKAGIFVIFCFLGWALLKSVIKEIKRREEMEKLSNELKKAYLELEKLSKAKTEFLSIASHQLRTPLTAIKGYVSLILEGSYGQLNEKTKEILDRVYKSNERLVKLINGLLNISRIESGKIELNPEDVQMEDIISDIIKELENEAKNKNLYLKWRNPEVPLPRVRADKDKIREVIFNIIDNAIKYTASGGAEITCEVLGDFLRIKIKDSGAGMTQEEISGIFKSFTRGETGTKIWTGGTGLGLYVAKKFIEIQNGKIWAESEGKDRGSTFYVELPIK